MAIIVQFAALLLASMALANIKTITPKNDEIIEIKTALGIATIIQLPEVIQSAIIGDQSAYRIEYVDQAVTIKPLRSGAKTNLYLFTKEKRYNLRLTVAPQNQAYYIVYIKKADVGSGPKWMTIGKAVSNSDLTFKVVRAASTADGFLLLDLSLSAKKSLKIQPSDIWLYEDAESKTIHSLFISKTEIRKDQIAFVGLSVRRSDLGPKGLIIEIRNSGKSLRIDLPARGTLWK